LYLLPAFAQQAAPVSTSEQMTFYQKAIGVLQQQRNKAEDDVAQATAQAQQWKEQLDRALAEVKTLKEQQAAAQPPAAPVAPPKSETK
jgi:predicted  nucleic acid-binding Zn-ribbon protein